MATAPIDALSEWQECRTTIGRFDTILADLRKYGFTLVTLLLAANALVTTSNPVVDRVAAAIVVMLLLLVLFMIDNFYWALLLAAVERALDIENMNMDDQVHISRALSVKAKSAHATEIVLAVYAMYVVISAGIAFTALITAHPIALVGLLVLGVAVALEFVAMLGVYAWVESGVVRQLFIRAARSMGYPKSVMATTPPPETSPE